MMSFSTDTEKAKKGIFFASVSCILFVLLTFAAMISYPGGTYEDHYTVGYSFWENFFSDLGRLTTFLGEPKTLSLVLFVTAMTLVGLAFISFSLYMPLLADSSEKSYKYFRYGSFFGFLAGLGFIGVGFTPWEVLLIPHILAVYLAFISFLMLVLFYSAGIMKKADYPNIYAYVFLFFAVILAAYILLLFVGPSVESELGLIINATGQKVIVYLAVVIMFVEALGVLRYLDNKCK